MARDNSSGEACDVWDVGADAEQSLYECTRCGWTEQASESPGTCPECGHTVRNCAMPIE